MAASVYKWLWVSLVVFFSVGASTPNKHPLHVSTVEIEHNASEKTLEVSCRIFTDDFEEVLTKLYKTKADFSNAASKAQLDELVKKYIGTHLVIKTDGKIQPLSFVGWEKENEAIYMYFTAITVQPFKKAEVITTVLHDQYNDQMNIVHMIVGGNRKSTKLNYPEKVAAFTW